MLNDIMLSVVMLSVVMPNVVMLSVVIVSVVAPQNKYYLVLQRNLSYFPDPIHRKSLISATF